MSSFLCTLDDANASTHRCIGIAVAISTLSLLTNIAMKTLFLEHAKRPLRALEDDSIDNHCDKDTVLKDAGVDDCAQE